MDRLRNVCNTLTAQSLSPIIQLSHKFQWEGLTNATTPIHHIGRRVCEKSVNNPRQSTGGKVTTKVPQIMWKTINDHAHSSIHLRRTIMDEDSNYDPLQSDWIDDMLYEDNCPPEYEELPSNA